MQVTETVNSGLKRQIKVTVPRDDLEARLMRRLDDAKGKVRINGFRPGKVPMQHLRKVYGRSFMAEVVNEILSKETQSILAGRGEKAAMQPEISMTEDEKEAEKVLAGGADFEFNIAYEVIPEIEVKDFSGIKVSRPVYDVPEAEVDDQVRRIAESTRSFEPKDGAAAEGDRVSIDYVGKIDGEAFEGGTGADQQLVLGSKQFIPGFEEQLIGASVGEERTVNVTFPEDYSAAHLAGKAATFDVTIKEVAAPGAFELNDEAAKALGLESVDRLREIVRGQIESQFGGMTRQKVKRQLLDQLDAQYKFEAPSKLVEAEFTNIWNQVARDLQAAGRSFEDEGTTEEDARKEYTGLAERRVRLGLVLAEIGEKAGVQVSDDELQRALFETIRRFPGDQQQQVYEYYRSNPGALTSIRAPLFEEKVVDHLLAQVDVTDQKVSKEELMAEDELPGAAAGGDEGGGPAQAGESAEGEAQSVAATASEAGEEAAAAPKKRAAPKRKKAAETAQGEPAAE
ncbi:MAG TPA: trigger factor [Mesorhizobium sp.]|nr:trigger factor [Mesorhizobium sp.]